MVKLYKSKVQSQRLTFGIRQAVANLSCTSWRGCVFCERLRDSNDWVDIPTGISKRIFRTEHVAPWFIMNHDASCTLIINQRSDDRTYHLAMFGYGFNLFPILHQYIIRSTHMKHDKMCSSGIVIPFAVLVMDLIIHPQRKTSTQQLVRLMINKKTSHVEGK